MRRVLPIFLLIVVLVSACQAVGIPAAPEMASTPTVRKQTLPPQSSVTPAFTATPDLPKELAVNDADLRATQIRFLHPLAGQAAAVLESQVERFNRSNEWKIRVEVVAPGSVLALENTLNQAGESNAPDVVLAPSETLAAWGEKALVDLTLYLGDPQNGMDSGLRDAYDPRYWGQDSSGEKQWGIPVLRTALGLVYNRTFAADLGFSSPPATPAQLAEQACASAKENNRFYTRYGTGGWMLDIRPLTALSWLTAFGAQPKPVEDSAAWKFDTPEAARALAFLNRLQADGCVWIPKFPTPQTYLAGRQAFLYTATLQDLVPQKGAMEVAGSKDEWTMIPFPMEKGAGFVYAYGYSLGVVRSDAKRQMAAWLLVRWLSGEERLGELTEAWPSLPVRVDVRSRLESKSAEFPWSVILPLADRAVPAPSEASWRVVRRPLEDAFWQTFNLASPDQLNTILPMLDTMAAELMNSP